MTFRSRLTHRTVPALPEDAVNGEYRAVRAGQINGVAVAPGDYLLADVKGRVGQSDTVLDWRGHAPSEEELLGLRSMSRICRGMEGRPLSRWLGLPPLSPDLDERAHLLPLERLLLQAIPHLQHICADPRTSLHAEDVMMPVSRVRRTSRRVLTHLAAHPEDWMQPTAHGVRPSHLLASVRSETLNIYENRVTAVLLKRLGRHLQGRLHNLARLRNKFSSLGDFSEVARQGTYARQQRLYTLWSEAGLEGPETYVRQLDAVIAELQRLKRKLDRCRNSELYRELQQCRIEGHLQITNVFRNESRYRHVALLWHAAEAAPRLGNNAAEVAHELQALATGFTTYTALLVIRALAQLGYAPLLDSAWHSQTSAPWRAGADELTLAWEEEGVLSLTCQDTPLLRIVPLLSKRVPTVASPSAGPPVLAVLFDPDEEVATRPPLPHHAPGLASVGVSPDDLRSLERVARALAPVTRGRVFSHYPIEVPRLNDQAPGWVRSGKQRWSLDRLPPLLEVETLLERARESARGQAGRVQGRAERRQGEALAQQITEFEAGLDHLSTLQTCPQCRSKAVTFEPRQGGTYAAQCTSCHARWGLRQCPRCSLRYPYLLPKLETWPAADSLTRHWADDLFGMDLLSRPDPASKGRQFECPMCVPGGEG